MTSVQTPSFKAAATGKSSKKSQPGNSYYAVSRLASAGQRHEFVDVYGRTASGSNAPGRWTSDLNEALVVRSNQTARDVAIDPNVYTHYFGFPYANDPRLRAGLRVMAKPGDFRAFFSSIYAPYSNWINETITLSRVDTSTLPNTLYTNLTSLGYTLGAIPDTETNPNGYAEFVAMMWMLYTSYNPFNVDTTGNTRVAFDAGRHVGSLDLTESYDQFAQAESTARGALAKTREAKAGKAAPMDPMRASALVAGFALLTKNKRGVETRESTQGKAATGKHRGGRNAESFVEDYNKLVADTTSKKYVLVATVNKGENVTFSATGTTNGKTTYSGRNTISLPTGRSVVGDYSYLDLPGANRLVVRRTNEKWLEGLTLAARLVLNDPTLSEAVVAANTKPITNMEGSTAAGLFNPNHI